MNSIGALVVLIGLNLSFALEFQLIGGVVSIQILPVLPRGLYARWYHRWALVRGWVAGMDCHLHTLGDPGQDRRLFQQRLVRVQDLGLRHQGDDLDRIAGLLST